MHVPATLDRQAPGYASADASSTLVGIAVRPQDRRGLGRSL